MLEDLIGKIENDNKNTKEGRELILVDGQADNAEVKVVVNGNKTVRQILISQKVFDKRDKEEIEKLVQIAVNRALENVDGLINENDNKA